MEKGFRHDLLVSLWPGMSWLDQGKEGQGMMVLMMSDQDAGFIHDIGLIIVIVSEGASLLKESDRLVKVTLRKFDIGQIIQDRRLVGIIPERKLQLDSRLLKVSLLDIGIGFLFLYISLDFRLSHRSATDTRKKNRYQDKSPGHEAGHTTHFHDPSSFQLFDM
jgi:hypothetical protein